MKTPTAPSANIYPDLPVEDGQNYRLQKISEIEKTLITERDNRKDLYKRYNRWVNVTDGVDTTLITGSIAMAGVGFGIPFAMPIQVVAMIGGVLGFGIKLIRRRLLTKSRKHYEIRAMAEAKLNSIKNLISKALTDGQISDNEFKLVLDELDKYNSLKENLHSKQTGISDSERKKLIEEGKAQARNEFKKKMESV